MKKGRIIRFDRDTGYGRLKVIDQDRPHLDYQELWFSWNNVSMCFDLLRDGIEVLVDVKEFEGVPYINEIKTTIE